MPENDDVKKLSADFTAFTDKLHKQKGSNVTTFTPEHKEEYDALLARLSKLAE